MGTTHALLLWSIAMLVTTAAPHAQEKDKSMSKSDPNLELKLVAKKDTYKIPAEWRGGKLKEKIAVDAIPKAPEVDLELQIINKGKSDRMLRVESDAGKVLLELKGPGAVSAPAMRFFTQEFRAGKVVTIKPGETHSIPWKKLAYGHRGAEFSAFWTEPGDYTLVATLILPDDPMDVGKPGKLELTSAEVKIRAEAE